MNYCRSAIYFVLTVTWSVVIGNGSTSVIDTLQFDVHRLYLFVLY